MRKIRKRFKYILSELNVNFEKYTIKKNRFIPLNELDFLYEKLNDGLLNVKNGFLPSFTYDGKFLYSFEFNEKNEALTFSDRMNLEIIDVDENENTSWQLFFEKGITLRDGEALLLYKCKCWGDMLTKPWQVVTRIYNKKLWEEEIIDYLKKFIKVIKLALKNNSEIKLIINV